MICSLIKKKIYNWFGFIIFLFCVLSNINAQQDIEEILSSKISLSVSNVKLIEVLDILTEKTDIEFCYNSEILPRNKLITVTTEETPLSNYLHALFKSVQLEYRLVYLIKTLAWQYVRRSPHVYGRLFRQVR